MVQLLFYCMMNIKKNGYGVLLYIFANNFLKTY